MVEARARALIWGISSSNRAAGMVIYFFFYLTIIKFVASIPRARAHSHADDHRRVTRREKRRRETNCFRRNCNNAERHAGFVLAPRLKFPFNYVGNERVCGPFSSFLLERLRRETTERSLNIYRAMFARFISSKKRAIRSNAIAESSLGVLGSGA